MGRNQGEQPALGKESTRPKLMIPASPATFPPSALAEDAAQPHSHPLIERRERRVVAVLEVCKPAPQGSVHGEDDRLQALPVATTGLRSEGVLELLIRNRSSASEVINWLLKRSESKRRARR
jgi:hypothetical protein